MPARPDADSYVTKLEQYMRALCVIGKITEEEYDTLLALILNAIDEAATDAWYGKDY
jgi:hypothetical protein